jgi:hypothetical protein
MDEVEYFAQEQWGYDYDQLLKEIKNLEECLNHDCWPIISFNGKDADLEPWGCTGIEEIVSMDETNIVLKIGGHKTFCPFEDCDEKYSEEELENIRETEQNLIFDIGYSGDWSGDDWSICTFDNITVPWVMNEGTGFPEYALTAQKIAEVAQENLEAFVNCMIEYDKYFQDILPEGE